MRRLVFIPVAADELSALTGSPALVSRPAHAVTPELLDELGYEPAAAEDAEYAALVLASVAALSRYGRRFVIVAEVDERLIKPGGDPANGEVLLESCPSRAMTAWFADEPGVDVSAAARTAAGLSIDDAWDSPEVQALLHDHDLLWNDVVEYRRAT